MILLVREEVLVQVLALNLIVSSAARRKTVAAPSTANTSTSSSNWPVSRSPSPRGMNRRCRLSKSPAVSITLGWPVGSEVVPEDLAYRGADGRTPVEEGELASR